MNPSRLAVRLGRPLLAAAAAAAFCLSAAAQGKVVQGDEVTVDNLVAALTPNVPTRSLRVERSVKVSLLITFETNSSAITPDAKRQLDVMAQAMQNERLADFVFDVEGHADPRGRPDYNLTLSQRRAESVRRYLVAHAVDAKRLKALGKGDRELLNKDVPAAPENRRVTFVTLPSE